MRILFVADGRSPIALNWIAYFVGRGHQVHLASTFSCAPDLDLATIRLVPVAFSELKSGAHTGRERTQSEKRRPLGMLAVGLRTRARQWLGPLTLPRAARSLQVVIEEVQPDLVHAMRIPFEGMLASLANPRMPLLISVWGNDFTLHAPATPLMKRYTRQALESADALHTDCQRDMRLAREMGFAAHKPGIVLPGAGGIQLDLFYPSKLEQGETDKAVKFANTVINPRGYRAYVRNDTFFKAIPRVLAVRPGVRFLCPTMADEPQARRWVTELGIADNVHLLPRQTRHQMAELFRSARLVVSPSTHDGTPNTLLEAMACGCLPVAGDIESLREWITPGHNGLLFDPTDPQALADAILVGLEQDELYLRSREYNRELVVERAAYYGVMQAAGKFYLQLLRN